MNTETLAVLTDIYEHYKKGSTGMVQAIETHCGFCISQDEIKRISQECVTAELFIDTWQDENWWSDDINNKVGIS